jgi:hypothetical protein
MLGYIVASCFGFVHGCLLQVAGEAQRRLDVGGLRALVTTGQQDYDRASAHREVYPVSRTTIDSQFRDAFANRFYISWVPSGQSFNTSQNARSCTNIAQTIQPSGVSIGFANFIHEYIVSTWLHFVNAFHRKNSKDVSFTVGMEKRLADNPVAIFENP